MRENIALNDLDIQIAPVAVGDREGTIEFAVDTNNLGFTSLNTDRKGSGERRMIRLPMRKLLGLVQEHGFERIDALKADIEGAEDLALIPFMEEAPRSALAPAHDPGEQRRASGGAIAWPTFAERGYTRVPGTWRQRRAPARRRVSFAAAPASRRHAHGLVEDDLLRAHAAGEGHRLDAGGDSRRRTPPQ